MNKHMKLVVSALFIVIILLAVAITRFYSDTGKSTGGGTTKSDEIQKLGTDSDGNRIFKDSSGLYGIVDSSDRILVSAEWQSLDFMGSGLCTASKTIKGKNLKGCIDYEGNLVVPLVYSSINRHRSGDFTFYTAETDSDSSCVVYSENFVPCLSRSWDSCSFNDGELVLTSDSGTYIYTVSGSGFSLKSAHLSGQALGSDFNVDINSRILLSKLNASMLEEMIADTGKYIEFAFTGSSEYISGIKTSGVAIFTPLFPDEENITAKELEGISDIYLYSVRSDDGVPHYAVSVTANTELAYKDETGKNQKLTAPYKAIVEFRGNSENDLAAVSGAFILSKPEYPQSAPTTDENDTPEIPAPEAD